MWRFVISWCVRKIQKHSLKNYVLCPRHYLSAPELSWDAIFFEKGTTGGISYISNRYSKAKNKYLNFFDPKQESKHIIYLDVSNLYGYTISKFLPTTGFKWIDPKEFDLNKYTNYSSKRCVLEVDSEYPKELQELHNDYPKDSRKGWVFPAVKSTSHFIPLSTVSGSSDSSSEANYSCCHKSDAWSHSE